MFSNFNEVNFRNFKSDFLPSKSNSILSSTAGAIPSNMHDFTF